MFQEKKNTRNYWNELREMETDFFFLLYKL